MKILNWERLRGMSGVMTSDIKMRGVGGVVALATLCFFVAGWVEAILVSKVLPVARAVVAVDQWGGDSGMS